MSDNLPMALGGGFVELEPEEVRMVLALGASDVWPTLRDKVLKGIQEAATVALRDSDITIEEVRRQQGRISVVMDLAQLVDEDAPRWYKDGTHQEEE